MGLDGVEIVMRTEEVFGIDIPNEIAAQLLTPAALVDFVAANVALKATEECLSQQLFYQLRRGFRSQLKALSLPTLDGNTNVGAFDFPRSRLGRGPGPPSPSR